LGALTARRAAIDLGRGILRRPLSGSEDAGTDGRGAGRGHGAACDPREVCPDRLAILAARGRLQHSLACAAQAYRTPNLRALADRREQALGRGAASAGGGCARALCRGSPLTFQYLINILRSQIASVRVSKSQGPG